MLKYVDIYKRIHAIRGDRSVFPVTKDIYHGYIEGCTDWYTREEIQNLYRLVDSIPDRDTLIHGDFHANNIMVVDDKLVMIDMGDISIGHPVFDFLSTASTQANLVELNPSYAEVLTHMPVEMIKRLWADLFKEYFSDRSETLRGRIENQCRKLAKLKVAFAPVVGRGAPMELIQASVDDAKENLLRDSDAMCGCIDW